jgi:hypothetical protein
MFQVGGYATPFIFGAILCLIQGFLIIAFLRPYESSTMRHVTNVFKPELLPTMGAIIIGAGSLTMLEPILPLILKAKFDVGPI